MRYVDERKNESGNRKRKQEGVVRVCERERGKREETRERGGGLREWNEKRNDVAEKKSALKKRK